MTISERIFELLKERGYTQKEFSKKTGIAESTISDWKKKGTNPVSDKILTICDVLEVSPYYLLSGTEREERKTIKAASAKTVKASASEKKEVKKEEPKKQEVKKGSSVKVAAKKQEVKKSDADGGIRLPEIATIARDEADYRIGKADEEKPGKKEKKKDKKDKGKDTGGKDKKKKKDKKKDKKKKGYLIVS